MNDTVLNMEDLLLSFEPAKFTIPDTTDYEDTSHNNRRVYNDNGNYFDVWVESNGNHPDLVQDVANNYDKYEAEFNKFLDDNEIDYLETEIFTDDLETVTFNVTIQV